MVGCANAWADDRPEYYFEHAPQDPVIDAWTVTRPVSDTIPAVTDMEALLVPQAMLGLYVAW